MQWSNKQVTNHNTHYKKHNMWNTSSVNVKLRLSRKIRFYFSVFGRRLYPETLTKAHLHAYTNRSGSESTKAKTLYYIQHTIITNKSISQQTVQWRKQDFIATRLWYQYKLSFTKQEVVESNKNKSISAKFSEKQNSIKRNITHISDSNMVTSSSSGCWCITL